MLLLLSRLYKQLSGLIGAIKCLEVFSVFSRSIQHLMILLLLPLSSIVSAEDAYSEEEQKYQKIRKVVVLDDGSTGSRIVSFLFGRNYFFEEFCLIKQSPMREASSLSLAKSS